MPMPKPLTVLILAIIWGAQTHAAPQPGDIAGRIVAERDGRRIELPLLKSDVSVTIEADMATIDITQSFANPTTGPLEAEYLFPLNQHAAVYAMEMRVGDQIVQAVIREKAEAEAAYRQAKSDGKAAALLTQHRPNMFTQRVANLMPGQPIEIRLRYVQMVPKIEGAHTLVIPLIVGPRYQSPAESDAVLAAATTAAAAPDGAPDGAAQAPETAAATDAAAPDTHTAAAADNTWQIAPQPDYPPVAGLALPESVVAGRVSLDLTLSSGLELGAFGSTTHPLAIDRKGDRLTARFADGQVMENRDLVITYTLGGAGLDAAVLSHSDARGGFLSLMLEPPHIEPAQVMARELIFVLDTSGSMSGAPMAASKRFMRAALAGLRPQDRFRIIPFSNAARHFARAALPATPANLRAGGQFVDQLSAGGGTEIDSAIRAAFATRRPADTLRIVVFLSDGYIGGEHRVLRTIDQQIGAARIYAFGVGNAVNRYLLDSMAEMGRGYARYVGLDDDALEVAEQLAADLKSPLMTDIAVDWGDVDVSGVSPARIPDLFAGGSVRLYARHRAAGPASVQVTGRVNGRAASMTVPLTLTDAPDQAALPLIWARNRIAQLERNIAVGRDPEASDAEITRLGLAFSLQSKNTSFIAVSRQVVNATGTPARHAAVPLPMVDGVTEKAYAGGFAGASTPEPETLLGLILIAALSLIGSRRWRRLQ